MNLGLDLLQFLLHLVLLFSQHLVGLHQDVHGFCLLHKFVVLSQGLSCNLSTKVEVKWSALAVIHILHH